MNSYKSNYVPPSEGALDFVYRDDSLLVVNKPPELLSVPGLGSDKSDSLATRVQKEFPDALSVHRLDMSTSGMLILARGKDMHNRLSQLFRERKVEKRYIAIISGLLGHTTGTIDLPIGSDWPNRPRQKIDFVAGKKSLTCYRLLAHDEINHASRIELVPLTGRTHQLRVHMAAIGHPIVGDALYIKKPCATKNRLMLHASELRFVHPLSNKLLALACKAPF